MVIWIFECNDDTQFECFAANLFGAKARWPLGVRAGELCLLYNYSKGGEHTLYGVFRAASNGARDIVPNAWGGSYPFQIRVEPASKERLSVPRFNIRTLVTEVKDGRARVRNKIVGNAAQELLQYYAASYTRDQAKGDELHGLEEDFRLRFPRQHHCVDGHAVRSLSEQAIDDWLSRNQVYHEYERLSNVPEQLVPDFTVYSREKHPIFIEFWGLLDDPVYQKRRLRKCEVYHRHRCKLVELYPDDLKNLDFALRQKLRNQGIVVPG